jgi:hypothetical protein
MSIRPVRGPFSWPLLRFLDPQMDLMAGLITGPSLLIFEQIAAMTGTVTRHECIELAIGSLPIKPVIFKELQYSFETKIRRDRANIRRA